MRLVDDIRAQQDAATMTMLLKIGIGSPLVQMMRARTHPYVQRTGGTAERRFADSLRTVEKHEKEEFRPHKFATYILFNALCHHTVNAWHLPVLDIGPMAADNPWGPARQSGAMSNVVVAVNAEGDALLSAARAAGPICLNMLLWGAAKVGDRDAVRVLLAEGADREWCHHAGAEKSNPLCVAAKEGHQEVVKEMLSDVTRTRETMAIKALPFAAGSGHEDIVDLLLKEVPRAVLRGSNEALRAVVEAAREGHQGIVEQLLAAGLDVDLEVDGYTPLQVACMHGRKDVAEYLLTSGADVDKATKSMQKTPLFLASWRGKREMVELLLGAGAEVDKTEEDGRTPLMAASVEGHREVVKLLLDARAEVDKADDRGHTPLMAASVEGHREVVKLLLGAGAEVDKAEVQDGCTSLMVASIEGHREVVKLLLGGGAEVDKADNAGATPLFCAGLNEHPEVVQLLLDSGADMDRAVNRYPGATRLLWASRVGLLDMARSLLEAGAAVNSQDDNDWETPLHWAARNGNNCSAVAEMLLASGAEVDKESRTGFTPLSIAAENGNTRVCSVLLRAGADINHETDEDGCTAICLAINSGEVGAALLLMRWEPSLAGLDDDEAESLGSWLADKVRDKEDLLQEKESEMDNLNRGIEEWCNAAAAACWKKHKKGQQEDN